MEKVSVIVPTYNREFHILNLIEFFLKQTYPNKELLILDDSPQPSVTIAEISERYENVHYFYEPVKQMLGVKLNTLAERTQGSIIVMFDDDDYYAPQYITRMVEVLNRQDLDFVTLSKWFSYCSYLNQFFYWEADRMSPVHYLVDPTQDTLTQLHYDVPNSNLVHDWTWGYGWKYVFRKKLYEQVRYRDLPIWENGRCVDYLFYEDAARQNFKMGHFADLEGLALHLIHRGNSTAIVPQHLLPNVFLPVFFKEFNISQVLQ